MFHDVTERRALERRTEEALEALLYLVGTLVMSQPASTLNETTQHLVETVRQVFGCEVVSLAAIAPDTQRWVPLALTGRSPEESSAWWATIGQSGPAERFDADQLRRLRAGEAVVLDIEGYARQRLLTYGAQAAATTPLLDQGQLSGMLTLAYEHGDHHFSPAELALAAGIGRLAALVLQRDRLLREQTQAQAHILALEEANQRMDEFLGIASHELRTPLTSLSATVQIAERQLRQALASAMPQGAEDRLLRTHSLVERFLRQVRKLDRLVGDLLDVTRISAGKLEMRLASCELDVIAREAVEAQQAAWPKRRITLDLPAGAAVPLEADADRLGQVVTNYLTNALKYSDDDQPVAVSVSMQSNLARVEVRDHGPGLAPDQQAQVFERFYRAPGI
jgi:signal transduction histidine kinase